MIKIDKKKTKNYRYNDWLEYFSQVSAEELQDQAEKLKKTLPAEGYAAVARWLEVFENPSKMDKLTQGRIKAQEEASIMEIAVGDDDEAFYTGLIRKNVSELDGASPQEVARISQNLNIYRKQLQEIRSRRPKDGSVLDKVLKEIDNVVVKPKVQSKSRKKPVANKKTAKKSKAVKKVVSKTPSKAKKATKTITKPSGENNG